MAMREVELIVNVLILGFAGLLVLSVVVFVVIDMFGRVDYLKDKVPWLQRVLERKGALGVLLLVAVFLLIGDGYELLIKEIPEVPKPPTVEIIAPPPPPIQIEDLVKRKRLTIRTDLGKLLARNNEIKGDCLSDKPPKGFSCGSEYLHWRDQTRNYILKNMDPAYLARFKATTGTHMFYKAASGSFLVGDESDAVNLLTFSAATLDEFIREFQN
jgi:hypothetical protein